MLSKVMVKFFSALLFTVIAATTGIAGPGSGGGPGAGPGGGSGGGPGGGSGTGPVNLFIPLSGDEEATLQFMREEEKLARDVYLTFDAKWDLLLFFNISKSEQHHMDAVKVLLDKYSVPDPVVDEMDVGTFVNEDLKAMYPDFVERGMESPVAAMYVGAQIEEMDIIDLQGAIAETNPEHTDIIGLYENLWCGSRNHLRAFVRYIERGGVEYEPVLLSLGELEAIVDSPVERGCGHKKDNGAREHYHHAHGGGSGN